MRLHAPALFFVYVAHTIRYSCSFTYVLPRRKILSPFHMVIFLICLSISFITHVLVLYLSCHSWRNSILWEWFSGLIKISASQLLAFRNNEMRSPMFTIYCRPHFLKVPLTGRKSWDSRVWILILASSAFMIVFLFN